MARARLTIDQAKAMEYQQLITVGYAMLEPFQPPEVETPAELDRRIAKTLDELPDYYAWFLQLHAYFDHWADFYMDQYGGKHLDYKAMREKRDAMADIASAAKLRYEGTSRRLTQIQGAEHESRMPRGR